MPARGVLPTLALIPLLAACADPNKKVGIDGPVTVSSQDQAGAVMVSATMVAPWSDVSAALKPAFTMTGDTAVTQVMPTTVAVQEETVNALSFALGVGLPQSSSSSNSSTSATGTTTTSSSTTAPGSVPSAPTGAPLNSTIPSATAPGAGAVTTDPSVKYTAAANFLQQVQLLNQEIDHIAARSGYIPYVVKFKLAVIAYRPHLAYAAHTRITFFTSDAGPPTAPPGHAPDSQGTRAHQPGDVEDAPLQAGKAMAANEVGASTPIVVPLLVADDLGVALKSQAAESAQQLGMALNVMIHGVGANAALNRVAAAMKAVTEQDLTSALTISREADDTLYAVIQPNNLAAGDPSLITKTYDVAVLVLVPRGYFETTQPGTNPVIDFSTVTEFRDVIRGNVLPYDYSRFDKHYDDFVGASVAYRDLAHWNKLDILYKARYLRAINMEFGSSGDYTSFKNLVFDDRQLYGLKFFPGGHVPTIDSRDICQNDGVEPKNFSNPARSYYCIHFMPKDAHALWALMRTTADYSPYKNGRFEVGRPASVNIPTQQVLLIDDGSQSMTAQFANVSGTSASAITARLAVTREGSGLPGKPDTSSESWIQPVPTVTLDSSAHVLTLTMPSLPKPELPVLPDAKKAKPTYKYQYAFQFTPAHCDDRSSLCPALEISNSRLGNGEYSQSSLFPASYALKAQKASTNALALQAQGSTLVVNGATGSLPIFVTGLPAGEVGGLTVTGASVLNVTSGAGTVLTAPADQNGFILQSSGQYIINFTNLSPGMTATVKVTGLKGAGAQRTADGNSPVSATFAVVPGTSAPPSISYMSLTTSPPPVVRSAPHKAANVGDGKAKAKANVGAAGKKPTPLKNAPPPH